jgi:hypothetical protein
MAKMINPNELGEIVKNLLSDPETAGQLDTAEQFGGFFTEIAKVVADYCGGEVRQASFSPEQNPEENWLIGVTQGDIPPGSEGVWQDYDPQGSLDDEEPESENAEQISPSAVSKVIVFVSARPFGSSDGGPAFAQFEVQLPLASDPMLQNVARLERVRKEGNLSEVRCYAGPARWDGEDQARLSGEELVVTKIGFWFTAYSKSEEQRWETNVSDADCIEKAISCAQNGIALVDLGFDDLIDAGVIEVDENGSYQIIEQLVGN